jgi:hypothetical protein
MTHGPDQPAGIERCRTRNALRQQVDALLRASGLEIRELATALAIGNPHDPAKGRIHITYATADVSHKRVIWDYLGPLQGHEPTDDPDREPGVDAATIIATLTGETPPSADLPGEPD